MVEISDRKKMIWATLKNYKVEEDVNIIIKMLQDLVNIYPHNNMRIREHDYNTDVLTIQIHRLETDKEFNIRIKSEKRQIKYQRKYDLKLFNELKKKYDW